MATASAKSTADVVTPKKKKKSIFGALFHRKKNKKNETKVGKHNVISSNLTCILLMKIICF